MAERTSRLQTRLAPETLALLDEMCQEQGISQADLIDKLIRNAAAQEENPIPVIPLVNTINRYQKRVGKLLSGEAEGRTKWPVVEFVPDPDLGPTDSYWTEKGEKYVWSGRYDAAEQTNMVLHIMGEDTKIGRGWTLNEAEEIAKAWCDAGAKVQEADAMRMPLYPVEITATIPDMCAAFVQWARAETDIDTSRIDHVCERLGFDVYNLIKVRECLTYTLTQYRGYYCAVYPWYFM